VIGESGSLKSGLPPAIFGSFQVLIFPRKTSAIVAPSSFRPESTPSRL
jgi:hypothetical protein